MRWQNVNEMLEVLQKILIGLFGCALIFFPIAYRIMDKVRFHGRMCVRQMDGDLRRWIDAAAALVKLDERDKESIEGFERLASDYKALKASREEDKVRKINEIYDVVRKAAIRSYGDERAAAICETLRQICGDFSMLADNYNENAKKLNAQLDGGMTGAFGKLFLIRPVPILEDLSDLKC